MNILFLHNAHFCGARYHLRFKQFHNYSSQKIDEHFFEHWNVNRHFSLGNQQCYAALRLYRHRTENHNHFYHLSITENWMVICHNRSDNRMVFSQTVTIQLYNCLTIQFGWLWKTLGKSKELATTYHSLWLIYATAAARGTRLRSNLCVTSFARLDEKARIIVRMNMPQA